MGILSNGILSTIFGSGDVISKGMDLIDDIHTTDVELIGAKTQSKTALLLAYAPFKIAQRYLALMFGLSFLAAFWICIGLWALDKEMEPILEVMKVFQISYIMMTIIGFYFGGGFVEGIIDRRKK